MAASRSAIVAATTRTLARIADCHPHAQTPAPAEPQQRNLSFRGQLTDFVKEEGASSASSNRPTAAALPRKGALLMTETTPMQSTKTESRRNSR